VISADRGHMVATLPEASDRLALRTEVRPLIGARSGSPCPDAGQATPTPPGERPRYGPWLHDRWFRSRQGRSLLVGRRPGWDARHSPGGPGPRRLRARFPWHLRQRGAPFRTAWGFKPANHGKPGAATGGPDVPTGSTRSSPSRAGARYGCTSRLRTARRVPLPFRKRMW
jgi:hypothetical protein